MNIEDEIPCVGVNVCCVAYRTRVENGMIFWGPEIGTAGMSWVMNGSSGFGEFRFFNRDIKLVPPPPPNPIQPFSKHVKSGGGFCNRKIACRPACRTITKFLKKLFLGFGFLNYDRETVP